LPGPKDSVAFAADHQAYQLPAVASLAHDLLDGHSSLRQSEDGRIGVLAAQIAFILEALRGCQQLGIDRCRTDDAAYLAHRFADSVEKGPAGIPSDASDLRPAPRAAKPWPPLRRILRHDHGRQP